MRRLMHLQAARVSEIACAKPCGDATRMRKAYMKRRLSMRELSFDVLLGKMGEWALDWRVML